MFGSFMWVALTSLSTTTDNRNQAAANPSTILRYDQNALTVTVGQEFTVPIELVTRGKSIAVAEVLPSFDPTFFQAISLTPGTFLSSQLVAGGITSGGTAFTSMMIAKPIVIPASGVTGQGVIAFVKLKALKAGTSNLSFDQSKSRAPEFNGPSENIIGTFTPKTITITAPTTPVLSCRFCGGTCQKVATDAVCAAVADPPGQSCIADTATNGCKTVATGGTTESDVEKIGRLGSTIITVRTYFTTKAGFNPADNTTWAKVALFANNGTGFAGPFDAGSCATKLTGCGTPNRYLDTFITTIDTTPDWPDGTRPMYSNVQIPVSKLVVYPPTTGEPELFTKLSYAYFNDFWNPNTTPVTDRDVAITKVEFYGPNNVLLDTYTPGDLSFIDDTSSNPISQRFYFDTGLINDTGTVNDSQDGMKKAFDKVDLETIVQNQSRANGAWSMKKEASFNLVTKRLPKQIIALLGSTVPPGGTPATTSASLRLGFRQQALKKAGITLPTTVTISYTPSGSAQVIKEYTKSYVSSASGQLTSTTPLVLDNVVATTPISNVSVWIKTPTSLQKKIGTVTLRAGVTSELESANELFVGDFKQDGEQRNLFNILDVSKMLAEYKALDNPITDANRAFDVNFDNNFNILDASLVLSNYRTLELEGQAP